MRGVLGTFDVCRGVHLLSRDIDDVACWFHMQDTWAKVYRLDLQRADTYSERFLCYICRGAMCMALDGVPLP